MSEAVVRYNTNTKKSSFTEDPISQIQCKYSTKGLKPRVSIVVDIFITINDDETSGKLKGVSVATRRDSSSDSINKSVSPLYSLDSCY